MGISKIYEASFSLRKFPKFWSKLFYFFFNQEKKMDDYYYELGNRIIGRDHYKLDNGADIYNMKSIMQHDNDDRLLLYYYDP